MRKIILLLMVFVLVSGFVFADQAQNQNQVQAVSSGGRGGSGDGNSDGDVVEEDVSEGDDENVISPAPFIRRIRIAKSARELKNIIRERKVEFNEEIKELKEKKRNTIQNQNRVRLAVHSLLAMRNLTRGIGPQVSEIAREFNNSIKGNVDDEEMIQNRNRFVKFLIGGNKKAAERIQTRLEELENKVEELKELSVTCDCSSEIKEILNEQIQLMEQELERLGNLAEKEKKVKGLFGWLWK